MVSKLFNEEGDYISLDTGESVNMMIVEIAYTPDGINFGWDEVEDEEEAMALYNIAKKQTEVN